MLKTMLITPNPMGQRKETSPTIPLCHSYQKEQKDTHHSYPLTSTYLQVNQNN